MQKKHKTNSKQSEIPKVIRLDKISPNLKSQCGIKALNISRLIQSKFPIPQGFCITGYAFREHLEANALTKQVENSLKKAINSSLEERQQILDKIKQEIIKAPIQQNTQQEIKEYYNTLNADFIAVRSSATLEDLPTHSFAGQYNTFLGICNFKQCLKAIKKCWASLWNLSAFEYLNKNGIDHSKANMAVIIQKLIPADSSGIIFTTDPLSDDHNSIIIESAFGLGEPLVTGKVNPDRITISRTSLEVLDYKIADKTIKCIPDSEKGIIDQKIPLEKIKQPSLNKHTITQLTKLALQAEKEFGFPLDIEFAVSKNKSYFLQARPITTIPKSKQSFKDKQVWTNTNTGEVLPDVATPMTWSIIEPLVKKLISTFFHKLGLNIGKNPVVGLIAGRVYFNLNTFIAWIKRVPGMGKKNLTQLFGGRQDAETLFGNINIPEESLPKCKFNIFTIIIRLLIFIFEFLTFSPTRGKKLCEKVQCKIDELKKINPDSLSDDRLSVLVKSTANYIESLTEYIGTVGMVIIYQTTFYEFCRKQFGEDGNAIASRLLAGLGNNENADAGLELLHLANLVKRHQSIKETILNEKSLQKIFNQIKTTKEGGEFIKAWENFMQKYGHHCRGELELMNPRWFENPTEILGQLRSFLTNSINNDFLSRYKTLSKERKDIITKYQRKFRNPLKRLFFNFTLHKAQQCSSIRENLKSQVVQLIVIVRKMLLELERRFIKYGILQNQNDIFFLHLQELELLLQNKNIEDISEKIRIRRNEYEKNLSITPPPVVVGEFNPDNAVYETINENCKTLAGVAINPGIVTGPARVILQAGNDQVRPGEILVVPFTDPGWTPYFLNASAIVMDMGGILSHGSIIAREYGIPAVANVGPATKIIKNGQMIQVNGNCGIVTILSTSSNKK